jgi:hypothetical protein
MDIVALRRVPAETDGVPAWQLLDGTPVVVSPMLWLYTGGSRFVERIASEPIEAVAASAMLIELLGGWSPVRDLLPRACRGGAS